MYNQLIERNAIESLLNICQDEQPQYDEDYEQEIQKILKRTITNRVQKEKINVSSRINTISCKTPNKCHVDFRLKTETRSTSRQLRVLRIPQKVPEISVKQQTKPQSKSCRDVVHKNYVPLKASIVSLQNTTVYSVLNTSEQQHPVLVFQKKSQYMPRFILRLKQQQLLNSK